jgi:hypothetical protein
MIEKFASIRGKVASEFLHLNHTGEPEILVFPMLPKLAPDPSRELRRASRAGH